MMPFENSIALLDNYKVHHNVSGRIQGGFSDTPGISGIQILIKQLN